MMEEEEEIVKKLKVIKFLCLKRIRFVVNKMKKKRKKFLLP